MLEIFGDFAKKSLDFYLDEQGRRLNASLVDMGKLHSKQGECFFGVNRLKTVKFHSISTEVLPTPLMFCTCGHDVPCRRSFCPTKLLKTVCFSSVFALNSTNLDISLT